MLEVDDSGAAIGDPSPGVWVPGVEIEDAPFKGTGLNSDVIAGAVVEVLGASKDRFSVGPG